MLRLSVFSAAVVLSAPQRSSGRRIPDRVEHFGFDDAPQHAVRHQYADLAFDLQDRDFVVGLIGVDVGVDGAQIGRFDQDLGDRGVAAWHDKHEQHDGDQRGDGGPHNGRAALPKHRQKFRKIDLAGRRKIDGTLAVPAIADCTWRGASNIPPRLSWQRAVQGSGALRLRQPAPASAHHPAPTQKPSRRACPGKSVWLINS